MIEAGTKNVNLLQVLRSGIFKGMRIGDQRSLALLSHFGARGLVAAMRDEAVSALTEVKGIGHETAAKLCIRYSVAKGIIDLAIALDERGFMKPVVEKFYGVWQDRTLEVIDANPYVLLSVMDWAEVDRIGRKLGNDFHPCRVIGAIEWCMYQDFEEGQNTCTSPETLRKAMKQLIQCDDVTFERGLDLAIRTGAVIEDEGMYQVPATHWYETLVERFLGDNYETNQTEESIVRWLKEHGHGNLNPEQLTAVVNALSHRISAYYGMGGRGKTWSLKAIVHGATELLKKDRVILAAVAAKAKARMQAETGHPAKDCVTIAGLIRNEKTSDLKNSLIAVDEASMLSLVDAFQLFKKAPFDCHIVLMGDHQQIPSIQAGRVFFDIIDTKAVPSVELVRSHRHDAKTDEQLQTLLRGNFPTFTDLPDFEDFEKAPSTGIFRIFCTGKTSAEAQQKADHEALELYCKFLKSETFRGESVQIISPLRSRDYSGSSETINALLHRKIWGGDQNYGKFPVGTPVVWTRNVNVASGERLSNGSVGHVHEVCGGDSENALYVAFDHEGLIGLRGHEVTQSLDHAYCLSVHRAQGSEWDNVIILLPKSENMIDRNMVYTALSRCRKRSIVVYYDHAFIQAKVVEQPAHLRRLSLFLRRTKA